jgi:hypothetical protein
MINTKILKFLYVFLTVFAVCFFIFGYQYKDKQNKDRFYYNIQLKVVTINSESSLSLDKFKTPQLCNSILFETVSEPKQYMVINTCNMSRFIKIDTEWLYNHKNGDVVNFKYLLKSNFFTIK